MEKSDKMEDKRKHLDFIQGIINRHNSNSFMLKGWAVTISSALYAFAGSSNEPLIILIALAPIFLFWALDAYFLSNERCFVDLYNAVAEETYTIPMKDLKVLKKDFTPTDKNSEIGKIPAFNMNFKLFERWVDNSWWKTLLSTTIKWFYLSLATITFLFLILFTIKKDNPKAIEVNANLKSNGLELNLNSQPQTIINNIYPEKIDSSKITSKDSLKNR